MRTKIILFVIMFAGATLAQAQQNYLRLGVGAGVGLCQYDGNNWYNRDNTDITVKSAGLGSGFNANLAFGHMLGDHMGIELGINQFMGFGNKTIHESSGSKFEDKFSGSMLQVVPALVLSAGLDKINPYARLGLIVGIVSSVKEKGYSSSSGGVKETASVSEGIIKHSGGINLGVTGAMGVEMALGDKLGLYAEVVYNGITYAPKKGKIKESTVNGVDVLDKMDTKDKEWTYEKKLDGNEVIPKTEPDKLPKTSFNFSNVALNLGIKLKL